MNQYDRNNLNFIMSLPEKEFEEWYQTASLDDIDYAMELIKMARTEMVEQELQLNDIVTDTTQAQNFLKKFTLKA